MVSNQIRAIDHQQKAQRIAKKRHYLYPIFDLVRGYVSFASMDLVDKQIQLAEAIGNTDISTCSGQFTKSYGLPCKHKIRRKLDTAQVLQLIDFDSSWYLRTFGDEYRRPILPPLKAENDRQKYRRSNGSKHSTGRLESGFERVARETAQRIAFQENKPCWRCTICPPEDRWGHRKNMQICPKHPKHS